MFECPSCGQYTLDFDVNNKQWVCSQCGYVEPVQPEKKFCFYCRQSYLAWTWFLPSSCPHCHHTLLD